MVAMASNKPESSSPLQPTRTPSSRHATWPQDAPPEPTTAFSPRPSLRRIVVVADVNWIPEETEDSPARLLAALLGHPSITVFRHRDGGPPEHAERVRTPLSDAAIGWMDVGPLDARYGIYPVKTAREGHIYRSMVMGNWDEVARGDVESGVYADLGEQAAGEARVRDSLVAEAAGAAGADVYITERAYLHSADSVRLQREVAILTPEAALPLIGLHLRSQGVFLTEYSYDGTYTSTLNRGLWMWVGARALLPASWRWFSACVHRDGQDDMFLTLLAQTLLTRVQRALEARDAVWRALHQPQTNDTAAEALSNLDFVLLALMGAFDVSARVTHEVLGADMEPLTPYKAGWQNRKWRKKVRESCQPLAEVMDDGTAGQYALDIVRLLRNSVHGAALAPISVTRPGGLDDVTLVELPPDDAEKLLAAMDALGGRATWGVSELIEGRIHVDPGKLLEGAVRHAVRTLDDIMRLTPVERLGPIDPDGAGPENGGIFDDHVQASICWQLGLDRPRRAGSDE